MEVPTYFTEYVGRRSDQFPTDSVYEEMTSILKLKKFEKLGNVSSSKKKRIQNTYKLEMRNGEEVIVWQSTGKRILKKTEFFEEMKRFQDDAGHGGRDITIKKFLAVYAAVPTPLVLAYIKNCVPCNSKKSIPKPPVGKPIYSKGPFERLQIDLIDMRSKADNDFKWILHARDHFSKFSWAFPMKNKTCHEVTDKLRSLFFTFGPPRKLQCDNRGEFTGNELKLMLSELFPNVKVIHSRPRHPQTNGLIERANGILETRIAAHMIEHDEKWTTYLELLVFQMNTSLCKPIKTTPFDAFWW